MAITQHHEIVQATGVPVRITLACGWCSRRLDDLAGVMETATGRMSVLPTNSEIRLLSGRPVCPECGGPLFVDDWSRVRPHVEHEQHEQHDPDDEDASDLAAA